MRVGQQGTLTRFWAATGTRPRGVRQQQYDSAYVFGAVCPARDEAVGLVLPVVNTEAMALHLQAISMAVPEGRHALVVVDRAGWHNAAAAEGIDNLTLLKRPPAAPELNPVEQLRNGISWRHPVIVYTPLEKRKLLSKSILFSQLPSDDLDGLAKYAKIKNVSPREVIFHKSDTGSQMCIIVRGRVKLSSLSDEGKELVFGVLEADEIFGEISLLDGLQRSATVTAIEPTELLAIERRDFIPFLERHPDVAINLLSTLASRLRLTDEIFEDTLFLNLPARLAKKLLALADQYGEENKDGIKINLKLSQGEIGNLVGTSRESINKQMRAWQEEGLIAYDKGYVTLLQRDDLEDLTQI